MATLSGLLLPRFRLLLRLLLDKDCSLRCCLLLLLLLLLTIPQSVAAAEEDAMFIRQVC
jgi:hypothetical protein